MTEVENKTRICDLCGKTIHYKVIDDDGQSSQHPNGAKNFDVLKFCKGFFESLHKKYTSIICSDIR